MNSSSKPSRSLALLRFSDDFGRWIEKIASLYEITLAVLTTHSGSVSGIARFSCSIWAIILRIKTEVSSFDSRYVGRILAV